MARRILADGRYQRTLPDPSGRQGAGTDSGASRERRAGGEPGGRAGGPGGGASPPSFSLPSASGLGVARTLLWAFGAAVLVALVLAIARAFARRPEPEAAPGPTAPGEPGPAPLPDAAGLSEAGRYGEALHALLLAAISHGERRLPAPLPPSRTSRELTRLLPLHPDARPAFADLVRLVEGWLFGGAAVSRDDFARGAELYRTVVGRSA